MICMMVSVIDVKDPDMLKVSSGGSEYQDLFP